MKMKKWIIPCVLAVVALLLLAAGTTDSHHTDAKYIMWKLGWAQVEPETTLQYLNVDVRFRQYLRGKTKSEVKKWFPDLRPPSEANEYQQYYAQFLKEMDFLWIGESAWGIEFQEGKVKRFHLWKG